MAVTYWAGWMLAHPAPMLIFLACAGVLAVLAVLTWAENRRDDRDNGGPKAPRARARPRARGTRRQATVRACRRAAAWAVSWFWWLGEWHPWQAARETITLRARGITIDVTGDTPLEPERCPCGKPMTHTEFCYGYGPERPEMPATEPTRLATGAERDAAEAEATRPWADDTGTFTRIVAGE